MASLAGDRYAGAGRQKLQEQLQIDAGQSD